MQPSWLRHSRLRQHVFVVGMAVTVPAPLEVRAANLHVQGRGRGQVRVWHLQGDRPSSAVHVKLWLRLTLCHCFACSCSDSLL